MIPRTRLGARTDCQHYSSRTLPRGDKVDRCRLGVAQAVPFACPDDCLFFEGRAISDAGWQIQDGGRPDDRDERRP
jgi:hypothetical protein